MMLAQFTAQLGNQGFDGIQAEVGLAFVQLVQQIIFHEQAGAGLHQLLQQQAFAPGQHQGVFIDPGLAYFGLKAQVGYRKPRYRKGESHIVVPNRLKRQFNPVTPDEVWVTDITYIRTHEGWLYLAVIIDLYSRAVIGWSMSNRMTADLVCSALNMALFRRGFPKSVIVHSDRGSQYCSHDYQKILREHGFQASMSGKGNCYDNSAVESFFKSLKAELVWRHNWQTRREVEIALFEYINGFYNPRRKHSALGWKSPVAFEQRAA